MSWMIFIHKDLELNLKKNLYTLANGFCELSKVQQSVESLLIQNFYQQIPDTGNNE